MNEPVLYREPLVSVYIRTHSGKAYATWLDQEALDRLREPNFAYEAIFKPALYKIGILKHEAVKE